MKMTLAVLGAAASLIVPATANAAIVINIAQVGADVVATGSGSFNTTGLSSSTTNNYTVIINGVRAGVLLGAQTDSVRYNAGLTAGPAFGSINQFYFADASSGDLFGIYGADPAIHLPVGYISSARLSGSATYNNQTLSGMGLINGTYVYSSANDRVTVVVGPSAGAVPEPATWAMTIAGMGVIGGAMRRRRQQVKTALRFA